MLIIILYLLFNYSFSEYYPANGRNGNGRNGDWESGRNDTQKAYYGESPPGRGGGGFF